MTINKRLIKILKDRWSLLLGSIILCSISVAFLIVSISSGNALKEKIDNFMNENHVEDASFVVSSPLSKNDISNLEKDYNVLIEKMDYYDMEANGKTLRLLDSNKKINLYSIKNGRDIETSQEILIDENFAKANTIVLNEFIEVENARYQVVGFFVRPDYATPVRTSSDTLIDEDFGICLTRSENIPNTENSSHYSVIYNEKNASAFRERLYKEFGLINYLARENNNRIISPAQIATGVTQMAYMFGPILFLLTAVFCVIIITKILKYDKSIIGILYSIGYQKTELKKFYLRIFYFISIVSSILGITIGMLLSIPICNFYASLGNIPTITFDDLVNWKAILLGIAIPFVVLTFTGRIVINKYLKRDVILLLKVKIQSKNRGRKYNLIRSYIGKNLYSFRTLFRNKGRLLAFVFSVFLATAIMLMGLIMKTSVTTIYDDGLESNINYEYLYVLNGYYKDELATGEGIINLSLELEESKNTVNIIGVQPDTEYFNFNGIDSSVNLTKGFYISNLLAKTSNLKAGDKINLVDPVSLEKYQVEIQGIVDVNEQKALYTSLYNLNVLMENDSKEYNSIISNKQIDDNNDRIVSTVKRAELLVSLKSSLENSVLSVVNVLIIMGISIGIVVIYMITSMTVEESEPTITMLKVLGYKDKEISKMIFSGYKYLILVLYLLSIPMVLYFCEIQFMEEANSLNMLIHAKIQLDDIILGLLFVLFSYYIAIWISKKPIKKMSMIESLKKNRE